MTSGGFLIPLFPGTRRKQISRSVRPPSALCRLIRFYHGDCSAGKEFDNRTQNVRYKANE